MSEWTDQIVSRLQRLSYEGYSGSVIADAVNREFGTAFSRNAVIGKLHRMGCTTGGVVKVKTTTWSEPMIEALRLAFADGNTAQACARHVSAAAGFEVTVSALYAKAGAMGLNFKAQARQVRLDRLFNPPARPILFSAPIEEVETEVEPAAAVSIVPEVEVEDAPFSAEGVRLMDLREHSCRFPIGEPDADGYRFCGERKARGSYCAYHARIAYQPVAKRPDRAPLPMRGAEKAFRRFA